MVSKEILISKDLDSVYRFIEKTLCTAFKTKKDNLLGAENIFKLNRGNGNGVNVRQVVSEVEINKVLSFESFWGSDKVVTTYTLMEKENGATAVVLSENAFSSSQMRRYNYIFMSLPVLRSGTIKKLKKQLENLKNTIEGEGVNK
ncbi:MAG: hypothetical protein WBI17_03270 [Clostridiaceae bacterium]